MWKLITITYIFFFNLEFLIFKLFENLFEINSVQNDKMIKVIEKR